MKPQPAIIYLKQMSITMSMSVRVALMLIGMSVWVSCAKTEVTPSDDGNLIGFKAGEAAWNQKLRASSFTGNEGINPIPDMMVWGYYSQSKWEEVQGTINPSFMNGVKVTNNGGTWSYSPLHYYFPTGYHSFLALAPYIELMQDGANSISFSENYPTLNYKLPEDELLHKDILYGWALDKESSTNPVDIQFVHATTKLIFSAAKGEDCSMGEGDWGKVKSVKLSGLYSSGSLSAQYDDTNNTISGVVWSNLGEEQDMILTAADGTLNEFKISDTPQSLMSSGVELFVIPQLIYNRGESESKPTVEVLFEAHISGQTNLVTIPFDLSSIDGLNFLPGQALNLTMKFSGMLGTIEVRLVDPGTDPDEDERID